MPSTFPAAVGRAHGAAGCAVLLDADRMPDWVCRARQLRRLECDREAIVRCWLIARADGQFELPFGSQGDPGGHLALQPLRWFVARPPCRDAVLPLLREPAP